MRVRIAAQIDRANNETSSTQFETDAVRLETPSRGRHDFQVQRSLAPWLGASAGRFWQSLCHENPGPLWPPRSSTAISTCEMTSAPTSAATSQATSARIRAAGTGAWLERPVLLPVSI